MISGPAICASHRCASDSAGRRRWRSPPRPRRTCARTSRGSSGSRIPRPSSRGSIGRTFAIMSCRRAPTRRRTPRSPGFCAITRKASRSSTPRRGETSRRSLARSRTRGSPPRRITPDSTTHTATRCRTHSCLGESAPSWRPTARCGERCRPSRASTRRTCASWCITPCRGHSRRTTRRRGARGATANPPRCTCYTPFPIDSRTSSSSRAPIPSAPWSRRCTTARARWPIARARYHSSRARSRPRFQGR